VKPSAVVKEEDGQNNLYNQGRYRYWHPIFAPLHDLLLFLNCLMAVPDILYHVRWVEMRNHSPDHVFARREPGDET
jgi:hypothetical protein